MAIFGWKRQDGTRRYRVVWVEVPRKNGKSTLAAAVMLVLLYADDEPAAKVYSAAGDRAQAALVFTIASAMVQGNEELDEISEVFRRSIFVPRTASTYQVLSRDVPTKHGLNAHGIAFDEFHTQPDWRLHDVLMTSRGARRQPLAFFITTAGFDRHSPCYKMHELAAKVRDGTVEDDAMLVVIYAAKAEDDWTDEKTWAKANPGLGKSVKLDYLREECRKAQQLPSYENTFRQLHLNQWTEQATRWLPMRVWRECGRLKVPTLEELEGRGCYAGLDLSSTTDLTALVLAFPPEAEEEPIWLVPFFWLPEETIGIRSHHDKVPYDDWHRKGLMMVTPGNVVDYDAIEYFLVGRDGERGLADRVSIIELAYDPHWQAMQLAVRLQGHGLTMVQFRQGFLSMSPACKSFERLLLNKRLAHPNHRVLDWNAENVAIARDAAGNIKPDKAKSRERIDGIPAAVMAVGRMEVHSEASVYEERGIRFL